MMIYTSDEDESVIAHAGGSIIKLTKKPLTVDGQACRDSIWISLVLKFKGKDPMNACLPVVESVISH
jgi:hypothetical protein